MSIDFDTPAGDDQPDWMAESPEDPEDGGGGRLFLIMAIGLAGLIILGLLAVGGLLFVRRARTAQTLAQLTPTVSIILEEEVIPSPTTPATPVPATATSVPTPAATNTRVVQEAAVPNGEQASANGSSNGNTSNGTQAGASDTGGGGDASNSGNAQSSEASNQATSSDTSVANNTGGSNNQSQPAQVPANAPSEVPNTGFGGLEAALVALGLFAVLFISRRMRHAA